MIGALTNGGTAAIVEKWTEATLVVAVACRDLRAIPSCIWMIHDWIQQSGYKAVGRPSCVSGVDTDSADPVLGEVQWPIAGAVPGRYGDFCVKTVPAVHVFSAVQCSPSESSTELWRLLTSMAQAEGYIVSAYREIYHAHQATEAQVNVVGDSFSEAQ